MKKKILISTGGSGGHIIPALSIYKHLSNQFDIIMTSDLRGINYIGKDISEVKIINTPKLNNFFLLPFNLLKVFYLTIKSIILFKNEKIDKIISTGGYMSLPLCLSAKLLNLDIYLVEPNMVLGRANKFFLKFCKKIFCYSDEIKNFPNYLKDKIVVIKPLVREEFYQKQSTFSTGNKKFNLLIVGGSQGAGIFDSYFKNTILMISKKIPLKIIQQTNSSNKKYLKSLYDNNQIENYIFSFEDKFIEILQQVDACITRAGATTLAELSILNIPFLAIPLPTAMDNHQLENAKYYEKKGCSWILDQNSSQEKIEKILIEIIDNKNDFKRKKENLKILNYENTWNNVNQKLLENINEN